MAFVPDATTRFSTFGVVTAKALREASTGGASLLREMRYDLCSKITQHLLNKHTEVTFRPDGGTAVSVEAYVFNRQELIAFIAKIRSEACDQAQQV